MKYLLQIFAFALILPQLAVSEPKIGGCGVLPPNNIWNTSIEDMPVHPNSVNYINTIGANLSIRNDFGSVLWQGAPIGIPYILVGANQARVKVKFVYDDESDHADYPIPPNAPIEGGNESTGDRHILIIDTSDCTLYELYSSYPQEDGSWEAGSGAIFNLNSNDLRTETWTSADAAGLPILPGLVKYEEVASGEINHMIRFTVPKTQKKYLWPARHFASSIDDANYPPMGLVMRLKKNFDVSKLNMQSQVIATAMKKYGMILADNGSAWFLSGVPNENWDMDDLYTLRQIKGSDLEAVDISSLKLNENSGAVNTTSIDIDVSSNNLISPNPATDYITINIGPSEGWSVELYDMMGVLIQTIPSLRDTPPQDGNLRIEVSNLSPGVYFVKIGGRVERFVKM